MAFRFGVQIKCALITIIFSIGLLNAQAPQRIQIPGALLLSQQPKQSNPILRQRLQQYDTNPQPAQRFRGRTQQQATPVREIRPVVEEIEEEPQQQTNHFDEEVARLGLSSLNLGLNQAHEEQTAEIPFRPSPIISRQEIRDYSTSRQLPISRPVQQQQPEIPQYIQRRPTPQPPIRSSTPQQHHQQQQQQQQIRVAPTRIASRPAPQYLDEDGHRTRKPPVQILRKYRTDNADGSITWGYENEDGSFKEETIGNDCITRGRYGYVDPDGVKREYTYETPGKCEEPEEELEDLPQSPQKGGNVPKKPYRLALNN